MPQRAREAEVKVERRRDVLHLNLDLSLNLQPAGDFFSILLD
jgi:hypothetical protein